MKTAFICGLIAAAANAIETSDIEYMKFLSQFGKNYDTVEEFLARKEIFLAKDILIKAHNSRPSNFTLGHNKFSDFNEFEMSYINGEYEQPESSNAFCLPPFRTAFL